MSPTLVPCKSPEFGEKLMLVSTDFPPLTAQIELLPPRCMVSSLIFSVPSNLKAMADK